MIQIANGVRQPGCRAEQLGGAEDHEQREDHRRDRRRARRDDPEGHVVLAAEVAAGKPVTGQAPERHPMIVEIPAAGSELRV
jgi:hypothetical protein